MSDTRGPKKAANPKVSRASTSTTQDAGRTAPVFSRMQSVPLFSNKPPLLKRAQSIYITTELKEAVHEVQIENALYPVAEMKEVYAELKQLFETSELHSPATLIQRLYSLATFIKISAHQPKQALDLNPLRFQVGLFYPTTDGIRQDKIKASVDRIIDAISPYQYFYGILKYLEDNQKKIAHAQLIKYFFIKYRETIIQEFKNLGSNTETIVKGIVESFGNYQSCIANLKFLLKSIDLDNGIEEYKKASLDSIFDKTLREVELSPTKLCDKYKHSLSRLTSACEESIKLCTHEEKSIALSKQLQSLASASQKCSPQEIQHLVFTAVALKKRAQDLIDSRSKELINKCFTTLAAAAKDIPALKLIVDREADKPKIEARLHLVIQEVSALTKDSKHNNEHLNYLSLLYKEFMELRHSLKDHGWSELTHIDTNDYRIIETTLTVAELHSSKEYKHEAKEVLNTIETIKKEVFTPAIERQIEYINNCLNDITKQNAAKFETASLSIETWVKTTRSNINKITADLAIIFKKILNKDYLIAGLANKQGLVKKDFEEMKNAIQVNLAFAIENLHKTEAEVRLENFSRLCIMKAKQLITLPNFDAKDEKIENAMHEAVKSKLRPILEEATAVLQTKAATHPLVLPAKAGTQTATTTALQDPKIIAIAIQTAQDTATKQLESQPPILVRAETHKPASPKIIDQALLDTSIFHTQDFSKYVELKKGETIESAIDNIRAHQGTDKIETTITSTDTNRKIDDNHFWHHRVTIHKEHTHTPHTVEFVEYKEKQNIVTKTWLPKGLLQSDTDKVDSKHSDALPAKHYFDLAVKMIKSHLELSGGKKLNMPKITERTRPLAEAVAILCEANQIKCVYQYDLGNIPVKTEAYKKNPLYRDFLVSFGMEKKLT